MARKRKRYKRVRNRAQDIPAKANVLLNLILAGLVMIGLRAWHLSVVQYDHFLEQSKKPQQKVVITPAVRGTIRDRFNIPLALNKVQYSASIVYAEIQQIPSAVWEKTESGKKVRRLKRRDYISKLSHILGDELELDPERLEDLIHSKASFYGHIPFIIKNNITEKQYYRLKMLEKDWVGIHVQLKPERYYPKGKVACDIIGYMGSISKEQYDAVVQEINELDEYLTGSEEGIEMPLPSTVSSYEEAKQRLTELREKAYSINDYVGKAGIEARFEEELRGFHGKTKFYSDARGNFLRQLPGARDPLSGQRILLSISSELQEYAENLLIQNESIRKGRVSGISAKKQAKLGSKEPWIKGGAIVAMEPSTGEVVCMASFPRFDPNDFISTDDPERRAEKQSNICRWFETEHFIASVWHKQKQLERESGKEKTESVELTLGNYLNFILPENSPVLSALKKVGNVKNAFQLQQDVEMLMRQGGFHHALAVFNQVYSDPSHIPYGNRMRANDREEMEDNLERNKELVSSLKKRIDPYFNELPHNYDKVLLVDLCRLIVSDERLNPEIIEVVGSQSLHDYREANCAFITIEDEIKKMTKELFHALDFAVWRKEHQRNFLKEKRAEERAKKQYAKPYLDYLDKEENRLFENFWNEHRCTLLLTFLKGRESVVINEETSHYYTHFDYWFQELQQGAHVALPWRDAYNTLEKATKTLTPSQTAVYLRSMRRYHELDRELLGSYKHLRKEEGVSYEKHLAAAFYPRYGYGFARSQAFRHAAVQGSIFKLVTAYEALVQRYKKLQGSPFHISELNPLVIEDHVFREGKELYYGKTKDHKLITPYYKGGRLIRSLASQIGEVDLVKAMECSSNPYFSLLAGECLENPEDLAFAAKQFSFGQKTGIDLPAEIAGRIPNDLDYNKTGLYATAIGQHSLVVTPLQTAVMLSTIANGGKVLKPKIVRMLLGEEGVELYPTEIKRELFLPGTVRELLIEGMSRASKRITQRGIWGLVNLYRDHPEAIKSLTALDNQMIGKTSTGEAMENLDMDLECGTNLYNHVWYGGIVYGDEAPETFVYRDSLGAPELIVVAYLRYGSFGKDAAPVAAQVVEKWRELKHKYHHN